MALLWTVIRHVRYVKTGEQEAQLFGPYPDYASAAESVKEMRDMDRDWNDNTVVSPISVQYTVDRNMED